MIKSLKSLEPIEINVFLIFEKNTPSNWGAHILMEKNLLKFNKTE